MLFRVIAIFILSVFYLFYFAKIIIQRRQNIKTNQMGSGNYVAFADSAGRAAHAKNVWRRV